MTKVQAEQLFKDSYSFKGKSKTDLRCLWCDFIEHLYQSRQITNKQVNSWDGHKAVENIGRKRKVNTGRVSK